jgi:hypothetical protein
MTVSGEHPAVESRDASEVSAEEEQYLKNILDSPCFQKAKTLKTLLAYLWQHRGEPISEYSIAIDALGRRTNFDAKANATVRVQVARLRQRLKEFYEKEGSACPLIISIPLGTHELEVRLRPESAEDVTRVIVPEHPAPFRKPRGVVVTTVAIAILSVACIALFVQNRRLASTAEKHYLPLPRFWHSFLSNQKPAKLFLPTPVFFEWNALSVKVRDPAVNDYSEMRNSKDLLDMVAKLGPPRLMQNYATVGDTMAALKLSRYLEKAGAFMSFAGTTELTVESSLDYNIVLMGTPWVTDKYSKQLQENFNFQYTEEHTTDGFRFPIVNRSPRKGEPAKFETSTQSDVRRISYGLISVLPNRGGTARILTLRERPPVALVSFLTLPTALEGLDKAWRAEGSPEFFEVVVGAEFDGTNVLRTWPAAIRAVKATK